MLLSRGVKDWNKLPREVVKAPSLEGFKSPVDAALGDMVTLAVLGECLYSVTLEAFSNLKFP